MPAFDYKGARAAGYTDDQIAQFLTQANANGEDLWIESADYDSAQAPTPVPKLDPNAAPLIAPMGSNAGVAATDQANPIEPFKLAVSPILWAMDRLGQAGNQAAGGAMHEFNQPAPDTLPDALGAIARSAGAFGQGLYSGLAGQKLQPDVLDELKAAGWTDSPIPQGAQAILNAMPNGPQMKPFPVGSMAGAATSPEAGAIGASTLATLPFDALGGSLLQGGRAVTQIPKVAETLDVGRRMTGRFGNALSRGYTLPNQVREPIRDLVLGARGERKLLESEFGDVLDEAKSAIDEAARKTKTDPVAMEKRIRDILETGHKDPALLKSATPDELKAVNALARLRAMLPHVRGQSMLQERELGTHIKDTLKAAETAYLKMNDKGARSALARFESQTGLKLSQTKDIDAALQEAKAIERDLPKFTPQYFEQAGKKTPVEISSLGTKVPGQRSPITRRLSTSELENALDKKAAPLLKAFELKGAQTAKAAANARAITDIADKFGVAVDQAPKTYRKLSELGIMSGLTDAAKASIGNKYVDPEVFEYLDQFTRTIETDGNLMSDFLKLWKPAVTSVNPQFVSRNAQWNAIIGWIRGNRDPRNWVDAANVLGRANPLDEVRGLGVTADQFRKEMLQHNVIGTGVGSDFAITGTRSAPVGSKLIPAAKKPLQLMESANRASEDLARSAFYLAMRRSGKSALEASKEVARVYFDYSLDATSPFLNKMRESYIPFATWARNILPLTFRSLVENPSAFAGMGALGRETAKAQGLAPEDRTRLGGEYKETMGVTLPRNPKDKPDSFRSSSLSQVGYFDVSRAITDPKKWVMSQLTPLITAPAEASGIIANSFTGKKSDDIVELPPAAAAFANLNPEAAKKIGVELASKGRAVGPQWLNTMLRVGGPLGSSVFDIFSADEDARLRAARWLSGVNVKRNLNPRTGEKIEQIIAKKGKLDEKRHKKQSLRLQQRIRQEDEQGG